MRFEVPYWWQDIVDRILEAVSPRCEHCKNAKKLKKRIPQRFKYLCVEHPLFVIGSKKKCSKFISWRAK